MAEPKPSRRAGAPLHCRRERILDEHAGNRLAGVEIFGRTLVAPDFTAAATASTIARVSPWFPPRYLWAAIEGAAGLDLSGGTATIVPRLAAQWKWTAVRDLLLSGEDVTWFIVRAPDVQLFTNAGFRCAGASTIYDEDISASLTLEGNGAIALALRDDGNIMVFIGNTSSLTVTAAVGMGALRGAYAARAFNSLRGEWVDSGLLTAAQLEHGVVIELESQGFSLLELRPDV